MFNLSPALLLLVCVFALSGSFTAGWTVKGWQVAAQEEQRKANEEERKADNRATAQASSTEYEKKEVARETEFKIVEKRIKVYIDRPIYRNICLDDDGVRELNSAIRPFGPAASQPSGPVSPFNILGR